LTLDVSINLKGNMIKLKFVEGNGDYVVHNIVPDVGSKFRNVDTYVLEECAKQIRIQNSKMFRSFLGEQYFELINKK
jgi:hypothetical protein